jgi:hypothetical protein
MIFTRAFAQLATARRDTLYARTLSTERALSTIQTMARPPKRRRSAVPRGQRPEPATSTSKPAPVGAEE